MEPIRRPYGVFRAVRPTTTSRRGGNVQVHAPRRSQDPIRWTESIDTGSTKIRGVKVADIDG